MRGRHRAQRRGTIIGILLILAILAGTAAAGWVYRDIVLELLGIEEQEEGDTPTPGPSPSPSPLPDPSPATEPPTRERLVIHGTGDVNLDPSYIPALAQNGYGHAWGGLGGLFRRDDLTVVNLECPVSEIGTPVPDKEFVFRCDPAALPAMRRAGVEVANLANNHSGDLGPEALLDSRRRILGARMAPVGVGRNARQAHRPALFDLKGWRVAVLGFGGVIPGGNWLAGPSHPGMASGDDLNLMLAAVEAADRVADLVFVTIHWGIELDTTPRPDDVERARALIDAGADGIFGHHAHRLQPLEHYRGRPIAWGLGNFVWPNFSQAGSISAVAQFVVQPGGRVRGRLLPVVIESPGRPVLQD